MWYSTILLDSFLEFFLSDVVAVSLIFFSLPILSKYLQIIQRFVIVDLSNFYFDVAKDRLYVG